MDLATTVIGSDCHPPAMPFAPKTIVPSTGDGSAAWELAHELNNAAAVVAMAVSLLKAGHSTGNQAALYDLIEQSVARTAEIARRILGFSAPHDVSHRSEQAAAA